MIENLKESYEINNSPDFQNRLESLKIEHAKTLKLIEQAYNNEKITGNSKWQALENNLLGYSR